MEKFVNPEIIREFLVFHEKRSTMNVIIFVAKDGQDYTHFEYCV